MTWTTRLVLAVLAVAAAGAAAAALHVLPFPFYVGLFVVGPLAFAWFVIPAFVVPFLVGRLPVGRRQLPKVVALTTSGFAASAAYLRLVPSYSGNIAGDTGMWGLWAAAAILILLAAAAYLRESKLLTFAYHLAFSAWFFGVAFPYTGEFCC